jgi:hypothetical protein
VINFIDRLKELPYRPFISEVKTSNANDIWNALSKILESFLISTSDNQFCSMIGQNPRCLKPNPTGTPNNNDLLFIQRHHDLFLQWKHLVSFIQALEHPWKAAVATCLPDSRPRQANTKATLS